MKASLGVHIRVRRATANRDTQYEMRGKERKREKGGRS